MNCLPVSVHGHLWDEYKKELSEYDWKMHGILGKDGNLSTIKEIAEAIKSSTFVFHTKFGGDGYGFSIHRAFACGKPIIIMGSDYKDKLAGELLEDGITCIDLEKRNFKENVEQIKTIDYQKLGETVHNRFKEVVNFDKEFIMIKKFIERLV